MFARGYLANENWDRSDDVLMFLQLSLILECSFGVTGRQNVDLTHELSDRSNRL